MNSFFSRPPQTQATEFAHHKGERRWLDQILRSTQLAFDFDVMAKSNRFAARLLVIFLALAIIFIRMPIVFLHPAFWAEDGPLYFQLSYLDRWSSITTDRTAGYLTFFQWLVGSFSTYFPVSMAPAIFTAVATALTLVVVWLVTSPRLPLPAKPLLALTVVTIPAGYELLGALGNSQWIFPIGAFSILLMRPSKNRFVSFAEAAFVSIFSITGPFSLLLLPVCGLQIILGRDGSAGKLRMLILSGIIAAGATIEGIYILRNLVAALTPDLESIPSSWQLWLVLPIARITFPIGHHVLRTAWRSGVVADCAYCLWFYRVFRASRTLPPGEDCNAVVCFCNHHLWNDQRSASAATQRHALLLCCASFLHLVFLLCTANQKDPRNLCEHCRNSVAGYGASWSKSSPCRGKRRMAGVVKTNTQRVARQNTDRSKGLVYYASGRSEWSASSLRIVARKGIARAWRNPR